MVTGQEEEQTEINGNGGEDENCIDDQTLNSVERKCVTEIQQEWTQEQQVQLLIS